MESEERGDGEGGSTGDAGQWPRKVARAVEGNRRERTKPAPDSASRAAGLTATRT